MTQTGEVKVSERGQMALPAQTRHRWGLDEGGVVGWIDLGDSVVLVPGGLSKVAMQFWATPTGKRRALGLEIPSSPTSSRRSTL